MATAVWDHVTIDPDELEFDAGDNIEVLEMADKDWWRGRLPASTNSGWFPAAFVKVNKQVSETVVRMRKHMLVDLIIS